MIVNSSGSLRGKSYAHWIIANQSAEQNPGTKIIIYGNDFPLAGLDFGDKVKSAKIIFHNGSVIKFKSYKP